MIDSLQRVIAALDDCAEVALVWPRGLMNPGGPHRVLAGMRAPISIGEDECAVLGRLIERFRPAHGFIVGNGFGFSSCYVADMMRRYGGQSVVTLDDETGGGRECALVADRLAKALELGLLKNKKGHSPSDTASAIETAQLDLVFIDGDHSHPQVTRDFEAILPFAGERTIFAWHDFWLSGVPPCLHVAETHGIRWLWLPTSCEMVVGVRDGAMFAAVRKMFADGVEHKRPHFPLAGAVRVRKELILQMWRALTHSSAANCKP